MKLKLILLFLILSGMLFSQNKLYYSYEDFFAGKYEVCEKLDRELVKLKEKTGFYTFSMGEKIKDKEIKKQVKLIETKGSFYLNCRPLKIAKNYIRALHINNKVYFLLNYNEVDIKTVIWGGMIGGILGGALGGGILGGFVNMSSNEYDVFCLRYTGTFKQVKEYNMKMILRKDGYLKKKYEEDPDRKYGETMWKYLMQYHGKLEK